MNKAKYETKKFVLRTEKGQWIGNVTISSDGLCAMITDYGNFIYQWDSFGDDFESFLLYLNAQYMSGKFILGIQHNLPRMSCKANREMEERFLRNTEIILLYLKNAIKKGQEE